MLREPHNGKSAAISLTATVLYPKLVVLPSPVAILPSPYAALCNLWTPTAKGQPFIDDRYDPMPLYGVAGRMPIILRDFRRFDHETSFVGHVPRRARRCMPRCFQ